MTVGRIGAVPIALLALLAAGPGCGRTSGGASANAIGSHRTRATIVEDAPPSLSLPLPGAENPPANLVQRLAAAWARRDPAYVPRGLGWSSSR